VCVCVCVRARARARARGVCMPIIFQSSQRVKQQSKLHPIKYTLDTHLANARPTSASFAKPAPEPPPPSYLDLLIWSSFVAALWSAPAAQIIPSRCLHITIYMRTPTQMQGKAESAACAGASR